MVTLAMLMGYEAQRTWVVGRCRDPGHGQVGVSMAGWRQDGGMGLGAGFWRQDLGIGE